MVGHLAGTSEDFDVGARGNPADAKSAITLLRGLNLSPYPPVPPAAGAGGGEGEGGAGADCSECAGDGDLGGEGD